MTTKKRATPASPTIAIGDDGRVVGLTQPEVAPIAPVLLERLELARQLPIVPATAAVLEVNFAPGSIEAFRTLDGRTMRVVAVEIEPGGTLFTIPYGDTNCLAAQEIQPIE